MSLEHFIRAIAGTFILISLILGKYIDDNWYYFTAFVGLNLLQSAFTKWCLMEDILRKTIYFKKNERNSSCCSKTDELKK
ncbi:DUF2892 domain-containing protein [Candidatus Dependentiae bacterium]|nr:DUF2892 domain-containing protein [Candidatus Dependentiae bacterium]